MVDVAYSVSRLWTMREFVPRREERTYHRGAEHTEKKKMSLENHMKIHFSACSAISAPGGTQAGVFKTGRRTFTKAQRIDVMMKLLVALAPVLALLPRVRIGADTDDVCRQLGETDIIWV